MTSPYRIATTTPSRPLWIVTSLPAKASDFTRTRSETLILPRATGGHSLSHFASTRGCPSTTFENTSTTLTLPLSVRPEHSSASSSERTALPTFACTLSESNCRLTHSSSISERAASMIYLSEVEPWDSEGWLLAAHREDPGRREPLVKLALYFFARGEWDFAIAWAEKALAITERPLDYLSQEYAWGSVPFDILAVSSFWKGRGDEARKYGVLALLQEPGSSRLLGNLRFYVEL
jgi:hypothetical protein